jgi:hypothetical protein
MKSARSIIIAIALASLFSLTAYVMGQGRGPGTAMPSNAGQQSLQNQNMQGQTTTRDETSARTAATASPSASESEPAGISKAREHVKTSPTPPGKHLGWEKGKHNPHRTSTAAASASPSATAGATASATAGVSATSSAMPTATASSTAEASPKITAPPTQTP